jgi:hypothetical protein
MIVPLRVNNSAKPLWGLDEDRKAALIILDCNVYLDLGH